MKKRLCILVSLLALVFLLGLSGIAMAKEQPVPPPPAEEVMADPSGSITVVPQSTSNRATSLIKQWTCGIGDNSNGTVTISGETLTYSTVNSLDAQVYLQRWNGSNWVDQTSRTYTNSSFIYVSGSATISVTRGYYYRTRGVHHASNGGTTSTQTSVTSALLVQ